MFSCCWSTFKRFLPLTARHRAAGLVLASDFQRTCFRVPSSEPLSLRKRVQKYYLFSIPQALFSDIFPLLRIALIVNWKNFHEDQKLANTYTYINIMKVYSTTP
jgi:hypothetical protein